ncbi:Uncharacterised protein [Legionella feeleii]|uniref:Uncharacterized protein n=1 Tax=Legionella feeleii TaxID=453 RepID=A0A378INT4_9GAMM|nr:Uncharacterised protein [Legionella feeleii]
MVSNKAMLFMVNILVNYWLPCGGNGVNQENENAFYKAGMRIFHIGKRYPRHVQARLYRCGLCQKSIKIVGHPGCNQFIRLRDEPDWTLSPIWLLA